MYLSFITFVIAALFAGFSDILSYDEKYVFWRFLGLALLLIITLIFINTPSGLSQKEKAEVKPDGRHQLMTRKTADSMTTPT